MQEIEPSEASRQFIFESDRIGFGVWTLEDISLASNLWGNSDVTRFIGGPFDSRAVIGRLHREIESELKLKIQYWPIFLKEDFSFLGCCGLRSHGENPEIKEFGIHLLPSAWGKGIASEASQRVIQFAFTYLPIQRLFAGHHPQNSASRALLTKLGFVFFSEELYEPTGLLHPSYYLERSAYNRI